MSSILILPIGDPEPDLTIYQPIRQTRRLKYYIQKELIGSKLEQELRDTDEELLELLAGLRVGGKRRTRKNRKHRRKSRKSRKY